ncbi:hypothetical protein QJQ45_015008 [Haematococcus lacustris]|nr:hypothetical protein QJQ45_015008 [Haematococcus lacustris]
MDEYNSRQEYSPPGYVQQRSASAGRLHQLRASTEPRPYSALPSQALMYSTTGLQPMNRLPPGGVPPALYGMQHSPLAWRAESGAPPSLSGLPKPKRPSLHVQSLAIAKDREELAEEVVQLRQSEFRLKNDLEKAKKEERTLAEQLSRTRQAQTTAEQLLRNKQRVAGGGMALGNVDLGNAYGRAFYDNHLVEGLKEQVGIAGGQASTCVVPDCSYLYTMWGMGVRKPSVRKLRTELADKVTELNALQKSTKATQMSELQNELLMSSKEAERLHRINQLCTQRLQVAEAAAMQAAVEAQQAKKTLERYVENGAPMDVSRLGSDNSIAAKSIRKTLQALLQAHNVLLRQGQLLCQVFPPGLSMEELVDMAKQRSVTAGAPEALNFLRNHLGKTIHLPGIAHTAVCIAELQVLLGSLKKLRHMSLEEFEADRVATEHAADAMLQCLDEVRRLQGKPPLAPEQQPPPPASQPSRDYEEELSQLKKQLQEAEAKARQALEEAHTVHLKEMAQSKAQAAIVEAELQGKILQLNEVAANISAPPLPFDEPQPLPAVPTVHYKIAVTTSDKSGGAFDGKVYVRLRGKDGRSSGEVLLPSDAYCFDTLETNEFGVEVPLGSLLEGEALQSVGVRMMPSDRDDVTWHLDRLQLTGADDKAHIFMFQDWVRPACENLCFPQAPPSSTVQYEVSVKTSDVRGAGTDGCVYIIFVGDLGASNMVQLTPDMAGLSDGGGAMFARGAEDKLVVPAVDVGDLSHVVLRLEPAPEQGSLHSGWHLDSVEVVHPVTGMASAFNLCDWITPEASRATLVEARTWQARVEYTVVMNTSDLKGADYEGMVYLTLNGWYGSTREMLLVNKPRAKSHFFDRGASDVFKVIGLDVGPLASVNLRVEASSERNLTWHLDSIAVSSPNQPDAACFTYAKWITAATTSDLVYKDNAMVAYKQFQGSVVPDGPLVLGALANVQAVVYTSLGSAAVSGSLFITLNSSLYGSSQEVQLVNDSGDGSNANITPFMPGQHQEFLFRASDIHCLSSLGLRLATAAGGAAGWAVDKVQLQVVDTTRSLTFAKVETLEVMAEGVVMTLGREVSLTEYQVTVKVTDTLDYADCPEPAVGFTGKVSIKLLGVDAVSEAVQLVKEDMKGAFAPCAVTTFNITAADVGAYNKMEVSISDGGNYNWWRPERIDVVRVKTGEAASYRWGCWMLASSSPYTLSKQEYSSYRVVVHATPNSMMPPGDHPAYDGRLLIKLVGYNGSSEELEPVVEGGGALLPGGRATVASFKCPEGGINNVVVKSVGGQAPLHLRAVEVINESAGGSSTYFPLRSWLGSPTPDEGVTLGSASLTTLQVAVHTGLGSLPLPAGARAFLTLVSRDGTEGEELELVPPEEGFPSDSIVPVTLTTFGSMTNIASGRLRTVGGGLPWALTRLDVKDESCGLQAVLQNPANLVKCPGFVELLQLPKVEYVVSVTTSDKRGADTDGFLQLRLLGDKGESDMLLLTAQLQETDSARWASSMRRGATDRFVVTCTDVGQPRAVVLQLAAPPDSTVHSGWAVDQVAVLQTTTGLSTAFPCGQWIEKSAASGTMLQAAGSTQVYVDYTVTLVLYSVYESDLMMWLVDDDSTRSHCIILQHANAKTSQAKQTAIMTYTVRAVNLPSLNSLELKLPESSYYSMYLYAAQVTNKATRKGILFKYDGSLYNWNSAVTIAPAPKAVWYTVTTHTNSQADAGFDGDVYITLRGSNGEFSGEAKLEGGYMPFAPGSTSTFSFYEVDVGPLANLVVRCDPTGTAKRWDIGCIDVVNSQTSAQASFEHRGYVPAGDEGTVLERRVLAVKYRITTTTSSTVGAGTDGQVYITLSGDKGSTEEICLPSTPEDFSTGRSVDFEVTGAEVGANKTLTVRLQSAVAGDPSALHSAWFLDKVDVLELSTGMKTTFNNSSWVSAEAGSVSLKEACCVMVCGTEALKQYRVQVTTSSLKGAEFDGQAFITLSNWYDSSGELQLALPGRGYASFRAGNTVEFELRAKELSCISQVAVRMVPTDTDPTWHLDSVQVFADGLADSPTFYYSNWLDADTPCASLSRSGPLTSYTVVVVTGGQADAGFDGEAHVVLGGSWGSSVETQLVNSASTFEPGSSQQFDIKATDVDRLQTLSLRIVATGTSSQWFVEQVAVTHAGKGTTTVFNLNAWVKPDEPQTLKAVLPDTEYKLSVVTASDSTDSFDGRVLVSCCGLDGSVEEQQLLLPDGGKPVFAPGSSTTVGFKAGDVGGIQWVMLRLEEGSNPAASWKLDRLELQVVRSGFTTTLSCGRCLCVGESMYLYPQSTVNYKLTVKTSRQLGAAFDGEVYVTLGNYWSSGKEVHLLNDKGADAFAQAAAAAAAAETWTAVAAAAEI